jgi:poly(3-hydroxybutyrate) depolymerase
VEGMKKFSMFILIFLFSFISVSGTGFADNNKKSTKNSNGDLSNKPAKGVIKPIQIISSGIHGDQNYQSQAFVYVPDVNVGNRATATPIFLVYGDKDYTETSALHEAEKSGIGEIAANEEGVVIFINSMGDNWNTADKESLPAAVNLFSDSTDFTYPEGKSSEGKYPGSRARTYVFAQGKGADFAVSHMVAGVDAKAQYTNDIVSLKPTALLLDNVASDVVTANDGEEVPAYIINGSKSIFDTFVELNNKNNKVGQYKSNKRNQFDKDGVITGYENVISTAIRRNQTIWEVPQYDKLGITVKHEFAQQWNDTLEWFTYIPKEISNSEKGTIPLVLTFHGRGNQAEVQAWSTAWPTIGKENGFMVVSVNRHNETAPASVVIELLDHLIKKYPMIDQSRVYASGFSMGAAKSWELGSLYPERFAGIIPTNGAFLSVGDNADTKYKMPVFYAAGETSIFAEYPHQEFVIIGGESGKANGVDSMLHYMFKKNDVTDNYSFNRELNEKWGISPDHTYTRQSTQFNEVKVVVSEFKSRNGNTYMALASNTNATHEPLEVTNRVAWDFIKKFSRNVDGTIEINE